MPALTDRFRLMARAAERDKVPIRAEAPTTKAENGVVTLRLYDVIDSWGGPYGVSAKEFAEVLDALPAGTTEIQLHVNSPGGESTEGVAILNLLRQHEARVVVTVDGLAASAASFIACAADEVVMAPNAEMMVHDAWGLCVGNAAEMQQMVDLLNHVSDNLARIYADSAGGTVEEWRAVMAAETWFSDEEAVAAGLADRILPAADSTDTAAAKNRFDLTVFAHAGRAHAPAPQTPAASASGRAAARGTTMKEDAAMADTLTDGLRQRLGVADDADEATILAALDEALTEKADPPKPDAIPEGHVVVPEARLRDLEAGANAGTEAAKKLRDQERTTFLDSQRTKFAPANRAAWELEYDRDPEGTKAHFEKAPEIVALTEIGHADADALTEEDRLFAELFGPETKVS